MKTRAEWEALFLEIEGRATAAGVGEFARAALGQWVTVAVLQGGEVAVREMCTALIDRAAEARAEREALEFGRAGGVQ